MPTVIDIDLVSITEQLTEDPSAVQPIEDQPYERDDTVAPMESLEPPEPQPVQSSESNYEPKQFQPLAPIEPAKTLAPLKPKLEIINPAPEPEIKELKPIERPEPIEPEPLDAPKPIEKPQHPPTPAQPEIKRSLKKKTIKREQLVQDKKQRHLNDTLQRLKQQVRINETEHRIRSNGDVKSSVELMDIYKAEIMARIQRNWAVSFQLVGYQTKLSATLVITIMRNGSIRSDMYFEKKSGNEYFDECVLKAVKKSNPLPPLPSAYLRSYYGPVGLNFTPLGLK